jgi:hypothetical protein
VDVKFLERMHARRVLKASQFQRQAAGIGEHTGVLGTDNFEAADLR